MSRKSTRRRGEDKAQMEMTPMIDVVFQLLIFFIVTLKPIDLIGHLDVFRPQHDTTVDRIELESLRITVLKNNRFMLSERFMKLPTIERNLRRAAQISTSQTVLIMCAEASRHGSLVAVLDLCAKLHLTNLSVVTLPPARK